MHSTGVKNIEVLRPALSFLRQAFQYGYFHQDSPAFQLERQTLGEAILAGRLLRKLRELNPDLSETELRRGVNDLASPAHAPLPAVQQELYYKMVAGGRHAPATLEQAPGAPATSAAPAETGTPLRYFDFENPGRNDFLIVEQFQFAGAGGVRVLDAVIFVNGIPLAVFEARAMHETEGLRRGIERLQQLQALHEIQRLFYTVHFLVVLQKNAACYGGVAAGAQDFKTWEDCSPLSWEEVRARLRQTPDRESELPTAQDVLLAGMFPPHHLLELFRNFTAFVPSARGPEKKLAWCHQFHAVQAAYSRLAQAEPGSLLTASGAIVHPAGTGRSFSLFWLASKLRQEARFAQHGLLLLGSRLDLIELFHAGGQQSQGPPLSPLAEDRDLVQALQEAGSDAVAVSPKQFHLAIKAEQHAGRRFPPLLAAPLIVLVEALPHREQSEFLLELEHALPHAAIVAFTSFSFTPKSGARSRSLQNEIHVYSHQQAEREGYILPVKFELRLPEWHLARREAHPPPLEAMAERGTPESLSLWSAPDGAKNEIRLRAITDDIFLHFRQEIAANGNCAILLAADNALAARYFALLAEKMPGQVVVLPPPAESTAPLQQQNAKSRVPREAEEILCRFADLRAPSLLIAAENLPAHFSTPHVQAVYIDRRLEEEAVLEAAALTQRAHNENKTFGLLVDYWGVIQSEPESAAAAPVEIAAAITDRYGFSQFEELRWWRRELSALFEYAAEPHRSEHDLVALAAVERRAAFTRAWRRLTRWLDQLLPKILHETVWQEASRWDQLRREAAAFYFDEALAAAHPSQKLSRLFEEEARLHSPSKIREEASLYGQDFWLELETFETLAAKILRLLHVLYREIHRAAPADPAYYRALEQRVEKLEIERQLGRLEEATVFARLHAEAMRLRLDKGERTDATHVLAFAGILKRFLAPQEGDSQVQNAQQEKLAHELLIVLAPETAVVDWPRKQEVQREMRRKIKRLLREAGCPQSLQESLTAELMKMARARLAG